MIAAWLLAVLLAGPRSLAQDPGAPQIDLQIRVAAEQVAPGEAFTLTVVRVWQRTLVPEPWDETALETLHARLQDQQRLETGDLIEERLVYRCRVFALEPRQLPALTFGARTADGTVAFRASVPPTTIPVVPSLDPQAPGPVELPGGMLAQPTRAVPWQWWIAVLVAAFVCLIGLCWWHPWPGSTGEQDTSSDAIRRARTRLAGLRERLPETHEVPAFYAEAAELVWEYLWVAKDVPALECTTEQILERARRSALGGDHQTALADSLRRCDHVKFARHEPGHPDHLRLVEDLERLLRSNGNGVP